MKHKKTLLITLISILSLGTICLTYTEAQSTNGDIKLQINPGTSCCIYGNSINFGRKGISFSGYEFTGDFSSTIGGPAWTCSDMYGIETGWTLYVQMGTPLTNETNNTIPNQNVKVTYGTTQMVGGKCAPYIHSGTDIPLDTPAILMEKDLNTGFNYGRICALQTPTVKMRVSIDPAQAPGNYTGTLIIDIPSFMGTCDPNQILEGTFYDAAVDGLSYSGNMGSSGTTYSGGKFMYKLGERVTFSLGTSVMGTLLPNWDRKVFLPEIFGLDRTTLTDINIIKTAKLLQGLDQDNNLNNGISITSALANQITGTLTGIDVDAKLTQLGKPIRANLDIVQHLDNSLNGGFMESGNVAYPWARRGGGAGTEGLYRIINDIQGNIYIGGYFQQTGTFGSTTVVTNGLTDMLLSKLDTNGNYLRSIGAGGTGGDRIQSMTTDKSGYIYVVGSTNFQPKFGNTTFYLSGGAPDKGFIGKLDTNGNWTNIKIFGESSTTGTIEVRGVEIDHENIIIDGLYSGTVKIGNYTLSNTGTIDLFTAKLDKDFNIMWIKNFTGNNTSLLSTTTYNTFRANPNIDEQGNIYIAGIYKGIINFGGTKLTASGTNLDGFVSKLDSNGNVIRARSIGGTANDTIMTATMDSGNNIYIAGYFSSSPMMVGNIPLYTSGGADMFITKLDTNGNWIRAKKGGGTTADSLLSITKDQGSNIYIAGNGGAGTYGNKTITNSGGTDVILAKLDINGSWLGAWKWGSTAGEVSRGIVVDSGGNIYIDGMYNANTQMDYDTLTYSGGTWDAFVKKIPARQLY